MYADEIIWMRLKINWIRIPNTDVVGSLRNKYQPEACWGGITTVHCFSSSLTILDQSLYEYIAIGLFCLPIISGGGVVDR